MRNEAAIARDASKDPIYFMREGVEERWVPVRASMTDAGYAATLEAAKKMADASAFWSMSPLYLGKTDESGNIEIVALKRWKQRESGYWLNGNRAHDFETKGEL